VELRVPLLCLQCSFTRHQEECRLADKNLASAVPEDFHRETFWRHAVSDHHGKICNVSKGQKAVFRSVTPCVLLTFIAQNSQPFKRQRCQLVTICRLGLTYFLIFDIWTLALSPERQSARMSETENVGWTWMALNTYICYHLTPLHFKG